MDLVLIIGAGASGKMTVGQALMQRTGYRLFHNHMMIEPVIEIFGSFNGQAINRLREVVFEEFLSSDQRGMIFTYMWAFDMPSDRQYVESLATRFEQTGGTIYCVELIAPQEVRLQRNRTENRLAHKASKRDVQVSDERVRREDANYRLVSNPGEIPFAHYLRLENADLSPDEAAARIVEAFGL
ncbi:MAG: AAA family ATPase [Clostridia bacterium]|nr:AAA family ATPase [Clostridia bacterium]